MPAVRRLTVAALLGTALLATAACNQDDTAAPASSPAATSTASTAPGTCPVSVLSLTLEPQPDATGQHHLNVVLTNTGTSSCGLQGFPGVQLVGPDDKANGPTFDLRHTPGETASVALAPGGKAVSKVSYLPGPANGWVPNHVEVTLPDQTAPLRADWKLGPVLRQDGATHPGTYVSTPLQTAS